MSVWSRLANVFRAGRVESELDEELQFHVDERIRELTAAGMTPAAAAREAARRFGSPLRLREESRDVKLLPWLDSILRDVRLGVRMLRKDAVVTGASVTSLSLALGACVAAFSLVDALILRPLPVRHPEQLVYLAFPTYTPERPEGDTFNDPLFVRLREAGRGHVDLFAMSTQVIRPTTFADSGGEKERLRTQYVSGDAFDRLGVAPAAGRLITGQDDDRPGAHPVAVLSHAFWMRRFGGDPTVVGRWLALEDRQLQIIGVAEPRFTGVEPGRPTDLWLPYTMYNPRAFGNPSFGWFRIVGRVNDGVRLEQAQSVLQAAFTNFRREYAPRLFGPERPPESVARFIGTPLYLRPAANGTSPLRRQFERSLWILSSIAALVLLIAGSNVANLFLARTAAREREMALRLSIGAGRGRLIQQMLVESALVAGAACALGLLFAEIVGPAVVSMLASADDPVHLDLRLDWRLAAFAGGVTLLTTALFGLAPALRASSVSPIAALKTGGGRSGVRAAVMRPFVAAQVAFGLVVLFVGSLLVLSFARLSSVNPGFATSDVLSISLDTVERVDPRARRTALLQVLERLRGVPGVQAVSAAESNVLGRAWTQIVRVPGTANETIEATINPVTQGFFETMEIPVLIGRVFVSRDMDTDATAIVVNEAFATRYFGREPAIGRTLESRYGDVEDKGRARGRGGGGGHQIRPAQACGAHHLHSNADPLRRHCLCACGRRGYGALVEAARRGPRRESDVPSDHHHDTSRPRRSDAPARAVARAALRFLRAGWLGAGGRRVVRRPELFSGAADARDWHSRRARCTPVARGPDGSGGCRRRRARRSRRRARGRAVSLALRGGTALRGHAVRLLEPCASSRDAAAGGGACGHGSRVTGGPCRSCGRPSQRMTPPMLSAPFFLHFSIQQSAFSIE